MKTKRLLNPKLLNYLKERVDKEHLPIEIDEGETKDGLIEVLFVYPDSFYPAFSPLMDNTFDELFGPFEGGVL